MVGTWPELVCYALAVNWVLEKRSRLEKLGDVGDVDELKIDDDDDEGNAEVQSLDRMRGQTESDRRSLSKSIFRLKYMRIVSTDYICTTGVYYGVLKRSSAPEVRRYRAAETLGRSNLRGERNRCSTGLEERM